MAIEWDYECGHRVGYVVGLSLFNVDYNEPDEEWMESDWTATDGRTGEKFHGTHDACIAWCATQEVTHVTP